MSALQCLRTEVDASFGGDYILPLVARIHIAQGELEEAELVSPTPRLIWL